MSVGQRISGRLEKIGMSQAELARRTGLHQTTVNQLVRGGSRTSAHLHTIAKHLRTTAAYLAGDTEDPEAEIEIEPLTSEEQNWLDWLRAAAPGDRKALMQLAKTIATSAQSATLHDKNQEYRAG